MIIESSRNQTYEQLMAARPVQAEVVQKSDKLPSVSDILRPAQFLQSRQEYRNYALTLQLAYYLEQNTSIFADIVLTLQQEIFRRGFSWHPKFVCKCAVCGTEYQQKKDVCDCGCVAFIEPDRSQIKKFRREDGASFLEKANLNDQSLKTVLWTYHRHAEIADNPYLLCVKNYIFDSVDINQLLSATPIEFLPLDPREVRLRVKPNGMPQDDVWICVLHRDKAMNLKDRVCPICGRQLYPAYAETYGAAGSTKYYIKGEIFTKPIYYPGIAGGFPPILKILYDAWAYHHLERWTYDYYREGHGRGILAFPTNNQESLRTMWEELTLKWQEEPSFTPAIGFDPGSGKGTATFIKLLEDPNPEMLEVKKDLRERLGSFFGVSIVFQNDTSNSGGLKNDLNLMRVTARAVEGKQTYYNGDQETNYNDGVLSWICKQFGITDFVLQLNPSEDEDEVAIKERFKLDIENARGMWDLGFDVHFDNDEFTFSGQAKPKPEPQPFGGQGFGGAGSQQPEKPEVQQTQKEDIELLFLKYQDKIIDAVKKEQNADIKNSDELDEYSGDQLIKDFAGDALKAIRAGALYQFYSDVDPAMIPKIHDIIKQAFLSHRLSLTDMIEKMVALGLDKEKARMIARTESTGVAMKAREIGWRRMEEERGEEFQYKAVITNDHRTSPVSKRIKASVDKEGGAVSLDRLKEIYKEESTKPYIKGDPDNSGMGADWTGWENFVGHPYERDSIVRVV